MKKTFTHLCLVFLFTTITMSPTFAINLNPLKSDSTQMTKDTSSVNKEKFDEAMKEFKNLSRHERKERIKEAKKVLKECKNNKAAEPSTNTLLLVILSILLPPLAVYLHEGEINGKFWLDLVLTLLFWIPGLIYALIVVLS